MACLHLRWGKGNKVEHCIFSPNMQMYWSLGTLRVIALYATIVSIIDTDQLGTFTFEVERSLDPFSAAREKCRQVPKYFKNHSILFAPQTLHRIGQCCFYRLETYR